MAINGLTFIFYDHRGAKGRNMLDLSSEGAALSRRSSQRGPPKHPSLEDVNLDVTFDDDLIKNKLTGKADVMLADNSSVLSRQRYAYQ